MDIVSQERRSELMSSVKTENTRPEIMTRRLLHSLGFRFRLHLKHLPGKPDIVLPKYNLVVFIHGCFWHHHTKCPKSKLPVSNAKFWEEKIMSNVARDKRNIANLKEMGWKSLVIWECETKNRSFKEELGKILKKAIC